MVRPLPPASTSDAGATNTDVVAFNGQGYGRGYAIARVARKDNVAGLAQAKNQVQGRARPGGVSIAPRAANATYTPSSSFELKLAVLGAWRELVCARNHRLDRRPRAGRRHASLPPRQSSASTARLWTPHPHRIRGRRLAGARGLGSDGTLWKPTDGSWSNLRPDVPSNAWSVVWERTAGNGDVRSVASLVADLASRGAARGNRAAALASDGPGLAATLNYLAAYAVLLSQDRCTKNFMLHLTPAGGWRLLPGDSKSALGSDSGLGGEHAHDYAIEVADQVSVCVCVWRVGKKERKNSQPTPKHSGPPLSTATPATHKTLKHQHATPGRVGGCPLVGLDGSDVAGRRAARGRRLATADTDVATAAPAGCDAQPPLVSGSAGTFNFAVDALLRCPPLCAAFLALVSSVAAALHTPRPDAPSGLLIAIANATTARIAAAAAADNAVWHGGDPARGAAQLTTEQVPRRAAALRDRYSLSNGTVARLLPPATDAESVGVAVAPSAAGGVCVRGADPATAIDVSGWRLDGPLAFTLPPGAVIPPGGAVCVARDAATAATAARRESGLGVAFWGAAPGDGGEARVVLRRSVMEVWEEV